MTQNPVAVFKGTLNTLIERKELALPTNVTPEAFRNAAVVAVQDNPEILACETSSVYKSIRTLAAAGLVPDGREAALVPFKAKDKSTGSWISKCQAMPMVFGLIKMVRRSGEVQDIRAHIVYQNEVDQGLFSYTVGDEEHLEHTPILFADRGEPVAAYAIAKLKDGGIVREFMAAAEIDVVRRSSSAQRIYEKGKPPKTSDIPIGIWKDWWAEMWKKTVIRRLCKRLDMSSEDMRRVMVEQDSEAMRDITPTERPRTKLQEKVMAAREQAQGTGEAETPEQEPGQTIDGEALPADDEIDPSEFEFAEGVTAANEGQTLDDCPYQDEGRQRSHWLAGFNRQSELLHEAQ